MSVKGTDRHWLPMEWDALAPEAIGGPSLIYWQDCWYRLCRNKIAFLSMMVVVVMVLSAIFVSVFWPYSYEEQDLRYTNTLSGPEIYDLGSNSFVHVTSDYRCIDTDSSGHLPGASTLVKDNKAGRTYLYEINGKDLLVDYGVYFRAESEFITQEAAHGDGSPVTVAEVEYLREHYGEDALETVSLWEAERIPEDKIDRLCVFYDGAQITPAKTALNKTYIWDTDSLGRDLSIRAVYGARVPLLVDVVVALVNLVVNVFHGDIAGYFGGAVDNIMTRIVDTTNSIPMMLYVIPVMVVLGSGLHSIILTMGLTCRVGMVRIVRSQVLTMREQEFVSATILLGVPIRKILVCHLIPNAMDPITVALTMQIPSAMFIEVFLNFVGLGVSKPQASWGAPVNAVLSSPYTSPYQFFYPALIMSITILALNLLSDGLRDSLDSRLRK